MRKLCILIGVLLIAGIAFADREILIDFSQLAADVALGDSSDPTEHEATLVDFAGVAGSSWDDEVKKKMKTSLAVENWADILASSARSVSNHS